MDTPIIVMSVTNPTQEIDSLKVTENEDGTFTIEWDPCDSRYSVWNDTTQEEMSAMIQKAIENLIEEYDESK
jgi:CRISPR/Cas system-associated endonuclease/helicase Cas3